MGNRRVQHYGYEFLYDKLKSDINKPIKHWPNYFD